MKRVPRWVIVLSALVALYATLGFLLVPWVLKSQLLKRLPPLLHREVAIREVRFNPFAVSLTLRGLQIRDHDGSTLLGFEELYVDVAALREVLGGVRIEELRLVQPEIGVSIGKDGNLNFADLMQGGSEPPAKEPEKPLVIEVRHFILDRGALGFADLNRPQPFKARLSPLSITLDGFTTEPQKNGAYDFRARLEPSTELAWKGDISMTPLRSQGVISITGIRPAAFAPYFQESMQLRITQASLDLRLPYRFDASTKPTVMALDDASLRLTRLEVQSPEPNDPLIALGVIAADGISVDVGKTSVRIKSIALQDGRILARRLANGAIQLADLAKGREAARESSTKSSWTTGIDKVHMSGVSLTWEDHVPKTVAKLAAEDFSLALGPWAFPSAAGAPFEARMRLPEEGRISAKGILHTATGALGVDLSLERLPLTLLQPYVAESITASVSGALDLNGRFEFAPPPGKMTIAGDIALSSVALTGADGKELAGFDRFELVKLSTDLAVTSLDRVLLRGMRAHYRLNPDGTDNWSTLMRPAKTTAKAGEKKEEKPAKVSIKAIALDNLSVDFTDRSVQPPFTTRITRFGGSITPFSRPSMIKSRIDLSGKLDGASLLAKGTLRPMMRDSDLDLVVSLSPWNLPPTTGYGVKYAGYPVEKGKFSLDLKYTLQNRKLQGANLLTVDQLALGNSVESPTATKLPVKLALAILTDRSGKLQVDLPVEGDIDSPDFHFGGVIVQALLNVLTKVATSPFALLGSLMGHDEDLSSVEFAPGADELSEAEAGKLAKLAKALADRPALRVSVTGLVDPSSDKEGLLEQQLDDLLRQQLRMAGKAVGDDDPLTAADRTAAMRALWLERVVNPKEQEAARLRAEGKQPPPGMVPPREPPDDARARLIATLSLDPDDLADLGRFRAEEVQLQLVDVHHLAPERIFLSAPAAGHAEKRQALLQLEAQ